VSSAPELILADEPTGALDTATGREILKLLEEVNGEGTTVIVVTHDPNIAANMRRTISLADGRVAGDSIRGLAAGRVPLLPVAVL
jgi:putative ABC transport system ATP-binding protein